MKHITLITEPKDYSEKALARYRLLGPVYFGSKPRRDAHILVVGLAYQIDKKWIDAMPNLRVIASPATGFNHMDVKYAKEKGIKIISLRGRKGFLKEIPSTAEEAMGLLFSLIRYIPWAFEDVKNGAWDRMKWRGHQVYKKTLGLYGFGRLGRIMARFGRAFGMRVIAHDPYVSNGMISKKGAIQVSLSQLFKESDFLSLHVLLTDDTHNLMTYKHLSAMKPSAFLINTARGELIEKNALLKALENKKIAGAAIDVMWDERGDGSHLKNNLLIEYAKKNKNLIIVPHIGGATFDAMRITQEFIADLVKKLLTKKIEFNKL